MIVWIAASVAGFYAVGSLALVLLFAANLRIPTERPAARAVLVLPATGTLPALDQLLTALAAQSLRPHRLIVAVESTDDPAYQRVADAADRYPELNIELVVAGVSQLRSRKCTNLLAALEHLGPEDAHIVLFDADILPQPWWLAALVAPLAAGRADIVNGYRWQVPAILSPATVLAAAIDRAIAVLPRLPQLRIIWGGSLALTRHALEILDLPATIGRTLTEDLPIGDRAARTGLRVLTRRAVRVVSPLGGGFPDLWRFGRRQYQLIRLYRPGLWRYAAFVVSGDLIARLVLVAFLVGAGASGPTLAAILAVAGLGSITTEIRVAIGGRLGARDRLGLRLAQHALVWTFLPAPAIHASAIWGGLVTSPVRWGHVRYAVDAKGRVTEAKRSG